MQKYIQYINEFHNSNPIELTFVRHHLATHLKTNQENQDEIEQILDYLFSNPTIDISKFGYQVALEKTIKWHKKLQSVATKDKEEEEGKDYTVFMDFNDGFKIVQLVSKESYEREGKLMSHCVSSYYGRNSKIYSLRDHKNLPHCTIEGGNQIKGKGNGKIDPKYIDYIVKFLEKTGMKVGENEMKNLGYYKLDSIDKELTSESLYNGYIYEGKLDTIRDKNGNKYNGMGLWNIKPVCEIEDDGKFRLYEDIKTVVEYEKLVNKGDGHSTRNASSGDYTRNASSGHYTRNASSGDYTRNASSGDYTRNASSGHSTRNASSGHSTQNASSGYSTQNASSGDYTRNASSGDYTRNASSGDYTRNASSGHSTQNASSGHYTQNASSGDSTRSEVNGKYGITADIGHKSKSKGIIGTWIILAEYDKNSEGYLYPKNVKCGQIDNVNLKENTWYQLINGEFTEVSA